MNLFRWLMRRIAYVEPVSYTNEEVADIIEAFPNGTGGANDWD